MGVTGVQRRRGADSPLHAAGVLFVCQGRVLVVRRGWQEEGEGTWSIPGGRVKTDVRGGIHDPWGNAIRECREELGSLPPGTGRATRKHRAKNPKTKKGYVTFVVELPPAAMKWKPKLNPEHTAYRWVNKAESRKLKLHPNLKRVLNSTQVWAHRFYSPKNVLTPTRSGEGVAALVGDQTKRSKEINATAKAIMGGLSKDHRFTRLELVTVMHGPKGYTPVAGVSGVMRKKDGNELFFDVSVTSRGPGRVRVALRTRLTGFRSAAVGGVHKAPAWVQSRLIEQDAPDLA